MTSLFANKDSKIVVVDASGPVRQLMSDTIRSALGFQSVEGKQSVLDALKYLEAERADWIVMSLAADQPANALHFLKLCVEHPELRHMRVSLCVEVEERYVLPQAFELGLLSWHPKPFTKDSLAEEMKALMALLETTGFQEPLTAAHYLRTHLRSAKNHSAQYDLERSLLEVYPGNPSILMNLAEPQALLGRKADAKKTLSQAVMLDPKLQELAETQAKTLLGEPLEVQTSTEQPAAFNILGVETAVIVDLDESVGKGVEDILKQLGVAAVHRFGSGEEAWAWLEKNPEPHLMVLEWRIPKVSGPILIQRIRQHGFLNVPIIVLSSLLKPDDMPLVREIGVANIVQKPLGRELFVPALIWTLQQERLPTEHLVIERKIRGLLKSGRRAEADPLRAQLLNDPNVPQARKRLIEAEYAFAAADYLLARDAAVDALRLAGDGIFVLNLLGKSFMRLKNHEAALKCFKRAQELAPNNIERLCNMAESATEVGNVDDAVEALQTAKNLDPDAKTVAEAEVRVAIAKDDTAAAKKLLGKFESMESLVAYMNNKAVAYAKCGYAPDAIELYKRTLESIPDDHPDTKSIVTYNMALALVREGELEAAIRRLAEAMKFKDSKIAKKAGSLKDRIIAAIDRGQDFKFKENDRTDSPQPNSNQATKKDPLPFARAALSSAEDNRRLLASVETKRGDICCYLIFSNTEASDARVKSLLAKPPRFQPRVSIARNESLGAERVIKSAS